jgi:hypothetical protein
MLTNSQHCDCVEMCPPIRNRYFYGKLLDVVHFEREQHYFNYKRWMLNRVVTGWGVVCGMGVQIVPGTRTAWVQPGEAIDKCGREILICEPYLVTLPDPDAAAATGSTPPAGTAAAVPNGGTDSGYCCDDNYVHLSVCYHECPSDPVPAMGGDCDTSGLCSPGSIRETYRIEIDDGKLAPAPTTSRIQDVISGGQINYGALAIYVTNSCTKPPGDCCIPLANIRIPEPGGKYEQANIDITIRPIVYSNDLLYELLLAFMNQGQNQARGGKP